MILAHDLNLLNHVHLFCIKSTTSYITADSLLHHGMQPASPRYAACSSTVCSLLFRTIQPALSPRFPCDNSRRPYMFPITSVHVPNYVRTCLPEDRHVFPYCSFEYLGGLIRDRCALFCVKKYFFLGVTPVHEGRLKRPKKKHPPRHGSLGGCIRSDGIAG